VKIKIEKQVGMGGKKEKRVLQQRRCTSESIRYVDRTDMYKDKTHAQAHLKNVPLSTFLCTIFCSFKVKWLL